MSEDRNYEVGYGKPPKHTRFKPGQSGNPKGRKPGSKNVMTLLEQTLFDTVKVRENGKGSTRASDPCLPVEPSQPGDQSRSQGAGPLHQARVSLSRCAT